MIGQRRTKIRLERVTKAYHTDQGEALEVLRGVGGDIHDQEFVSLIGPSGCGKLRRQWLRGGDVSESVGVLAWRGNRPDISCEKG